jgi:hypothetical protein
MTVRKREGRKSGRRVTEKQKLWNQLVTLNVVGVESKAIPAIGRGGPQGCETSSLPNFLDNRLTDGGEIVSLTRRSPFTPRKVCGTHFY